MKIITVVVALLAAVAAGGFAWQRTQALEATQAELASANSQLQKSQTELQAITAEVAALRKEFAEQKMASERLRAELASAQSFLDAEKAIGARLRDELVKAKERLAMMSRPRAVQAAPAPAARPIQVQPTVIRAIPSGSAIGAGVPAR